MEAGKHLKKVVLKLGGNDVFIILENADMEKTIEWAFVCRMKDNGQCCGASKRFIAVEAIADEFIRKFKDKLSKMRVDFSIDPDTNLGPLSIEAAADQVKRSVNEGAKILLGGKRADREGVFMESIKLTDFKPGIAAYHEELFGPIP